VQVKLLPTLSDLLVPTALLGWVLLVCSARNKKDKRKANKRLGE
jgi:hypothetical protein